jgi:histidyl-tRNA synthetase
MSKPNLSPPSGTRDFFPSEVRRREVAVAKISRVYERFGFGPLETPALERVDILTGKYGDDEKLIFKIAQRGAKAVTGEADLALRYDFTVPLARVVANYDLRAASPFKRYQIGPVWRADRAARGRFREFFQCDADIVGSESSLADAEVMLAAAEALRALGLNDFVIRLNSRELLHALMESYRVPPGLEPEMLGAMDKLLKIGPERVAAEMLKRGLPEEAVACFRDDQADDGTVDRLLSSDRGERAYNDILELRDLVAGRLRSGRVAFDPFVARGLDYYTGPVFEIFLERTHADTLPLSIASGGRYDDLIGMFANRRVPACGASLGFERLMLILEEQETVPDEGLDVVVCLWDESFRGDVLDLAMELRDADIRTEPYLEVGSLKTQLRHASRRGAKLALIYGPEERARGEVAVKALATGHQESVRRVRLVSAARELLDETPPVLSAERARI